MVGSPTKGLATSGVAVTGVAVTGVVSGVVGVVGVGVGVEGVSLVDLAKTRRGFTTEVTLALRETTRETDEVCFMAMDCIMIGLEKGNVGAEGVWFD